MFFHIKLNKCKILVNIHVNVIKHLIIYNFEFWLTYNNIHVYQKVIKKLSPFDITFK